MIWHKTQAAKQTIQLILKQTDLTHWFDPMTGQKNVFMDWDCQIKDSNVYVNVDICESLWDIKIKFKKIIKSTGGNVLYNKKKDFFNRVTNHKRNL